MQWHAYYTSSCIPILSVILLGYRLPSLAVCSQQGCCSSRHRYMTTASSFGIEFGKQIDCRVLRAMKNPYRRQGSIRCRDCLLVSPVF
ncbi:hypothetical protein F4824DRAFT_458660 [Ustulina deusta]|nr:hypothetical protein F4824DRAFT_458660 [Ustulina deusta]